MDVAPRSPMTLQEFLAWEARQELRFEFDGVQPIAVVGGTAAQSSIQRNLFMALGVRLRGTICQVYGGILKILVAGHIRYPRAFVSCTRIAPSETIVVDPVVVFEVLGDDNADELLVVKNADYRATPSIQRYVVLQQTHAGATVFTRKGADWVMEIVGQDDTLRMAEIDIEIPIAEIYADIELVQTDF